MTITNLYQLIEVRRWRWLDPPWVQDLKKIWLLPYLMTGLENIQLKFIIEDWMHDFWTLPWDMDLYIRGDIYWGQGITFMWSIPLNSTDNLIVHVQNQLVNKEIFLNSNYQVTKIKVVKYYNKGSICIRRERKLCLRTWRSRLNWNITPSPRES